MTPKTKSKRPVMRTLAFRLEATAATTLEQIADKKGMTPSDFLRSLVSKVLVPIKENEDAKAAAIDALSPAGRKKVARAVEIKKELRAMRDSHSVIGPLDDVFEAGDDTAERIRGLERELELLKAAVEKEVASLAVPSAGAKKDSSGEARISYMLHRPKGEGELSCPKCNGPIEISDLEPDDAGDVKTECSSCGALIEVEAEAGNDSEEDEDLGDDGPEKSEAEAKADLVLRVEGLLGELSAVREKRSIWDGWVEGGLPAVDWVMRELRSESRNGFKDGKALEELMGKAKRAVQLSRKIKTLEGVDTDGARASIEGLLEELGSIGDGSAQKAARKLKEKSRMPFPFDWV
jgi:hypothetical protein